MAPPNVQADTRLLGELIGTPPPTAAGDLSGAHEYVRRIEQALSTDELNTLERRALYKQRAKWRRRADGDDTRWMVMGTRGGRVAKPADEGPVYTGEDDDALVRAIEEKFNPRNLRKLLREA
jgi:hypothetical protein